MRKFLIFILFLLLSFNVFASPQSEMSPQSETLSPTEQQTDNTVEKVVDLVGKYKEVSCKVADNVWEYAELAGSEFKSVQEFVEVLTDEGIEVKIGVGDMPTAFTASYGSGHPVIGLLAEYDSVSGVSQKAGVFEKIPEEGNGNGHGCGHNLLGAACLQSFLALRDYIDETGIEGTVILFGCPAEESGGGKTFMARAGLFDNVDIALSWHPGDWTGVVPSKLQADVWVRYTFTGKSSHAASAPEMGRSALDSVEIMNVGANYLREHVSSDVCFHYAVTDTGGISPNVVQNHASVEYLIRAADLKTANQIRERMDNIAKGSALMNGTEVNIEFVTGCSQFEGNENVGFVVYDAMKEFGSPVFSAEERSFAEKMTESFDEKGASAAVLPFIRALQKIDSSKEGLEKACINDAILPFTGSVSTTSAGTSDVGDVSQVCPTVMFMVSCWAQGTSGHSWQAVAQGKSSLAHTGMTYAAGIMTLSAINCFKNPDLVQNAWNEFNKNHTEPYVSPIPEEIEFGKK